MSAAARCVSRLAVVVLSSLCANAAHADQEAEEKAAAQALFEQGRAAVLQNRFAEACPKFAESQRLDPGIGTLLWLADCYENLGQTATAWATFKEAAAAAALRHDGREQVARERVEKLEPVLSRLKVVVPPDAAIPNLEVLRDGVVVGTAQWGITLPIDPGTHTIAARAPGRQGWSQSIQLAARPDAIEVSVPELEAAAPSTSPGAHSPALPEAPGQASPAVAWSTRKTAAVATAAAGLVGLGVGTYFAFAAKSAYDRSNAGQPPHCADNRCDPAGLHDRSGAFDKATVSTVSFAVGAAALAGGALLYFTAPSPPRPTVAIAPPGFAGFAMRW
jgi:hypothetical protein